MKCKDCKFYDDAFCGTGLCRQDSPKIVVLHDGDSDFSGLWPEVKAEEDWCGKWEAKPGYNEFEE